MCNCINETTEVMQKKFLKEVEMKCTVAEWGNQGEYQNIGFSLSGKETKIGMPFIIKYRKQKKNGEPEKNMTTEHTTIYPTYCPFCGKKYDSETENKTDK